ncbi:DUF29 domain-containing protein [Mongoliimonas terrestris]|uniref:DUF29 domain-containing protein n=1 Tax=Mongoliimonas terrestris TaxID=1709001 RepID=UPI000B0A11D3|nr:DUF29 domain-containing protein [Mongoliimonas terrestris]
MTDTADRPLRETAMGRAKEKPPAAPAAHNVDFFAWTEAQVDLMRRGAFDRIDWEHVIEEVESMGNEQKHALVSSYRVLLMHLLKWVHQPSRRSRSWKNTIRRERLNIVQRLQTNPSLKARTGELVALAYPLALREAAGETGLPPSAFPPACPWSLDELRDEDFLPA